MPLTVQLTCALPYFFRVVEKRHCRVNDHKVMALRVLAVSIKYSVQYRRVYRPNILFWWQRACEQGGRRRVLGNVLWHRGHQEDDWFPRLLLCDDDVFSESHRHLANRPCGPNQRSAGKCQCQSEGGVVLRACLQEVVVRRVFFRLLP